MWGGRFSERPDAIMEEINVSIDVDRHLYAQDIARPGPRRHACAQGIITAGDAKKYRQRSRHYFVRDRQGDFDFKRALEDIHIDVESRLSELSGRPRAGCTPRARATDQVATDFRLYVRARSTRRMRAGRIPGGAGWPVRWSMPQRYAGFTHLQTAHP